MWGSIGRTIHYQEVSTQYEERKKRAREIEVEWESNEQEQERLQKLLAKVEAEVEAKKTAQQRISDIQSFLDQQKKDKLRAEEELELAQQQLRVMKESLQHLNDSIASDEKFLADEPDSEWMNKELNANQQEIMRLQHSIDVLDLEDEIIEIQQRIQQANSESERTAEAMKEAE